MNIERKTTRKGSQNYEVLVDGISIGLIRRKTGRYSGWQAAGFVHLTRHGAERALINRFKQPDNWRHD